VGFDEDPEAARTAAAKSAEMRRRQAENRTELERLIAAAAEIPVPRLTDMASVMAAYDAITQRTVAGALRPGLASAAVRAIDGFREALDHQLDAERVRVLEQRVKELETELRTRDAEGWRR